MTDGYGRVVEATDYYVFGLQMPGRVWRSDSETREGYTGHELDPETGLNYANARYYDSALGRWLVVDPLAAKMPSWSPYSYSYNNPLSFTDPTGMIPFPLNFSWLNRSGNTVNRRFSTNYGAEGGAFGARGGRHQGVDMNMGGGSDDLGAPVMATHDGTVTGVFANSEGNGAGNHIEITSKDGDVRTRYLHLESMPTLEVGAAVNLCRFDGHPFCGGNGPRTPRG